MDVDEKNGKALDAQIASEGRIARFIQCDVSKAKDVKKVIEQIEKQFGALDILYNNASVYLANADGIITDIAEETWDRVISINLKSIYLFCK